MSADNTLYDRMADGWRDPENPLSLLKTAVNPWRVPYFLGALRAHFGPDLTGLRLLEVGCGGGLLAEELSAAGPTITGIDLSEPSLRYAYAQFSHQRMPGGFTAGSGTALPFPADHFDTVALPDVLEHIPDWRAALAEASRVLTPGGVLLFDTINRTLASYLSVILAAQHFPLTRIFPPRTHAWKMFIRPKELHVALNKCGFQLQNLSGSRPAGSPVKTALALFTWKLGKSSLASVSNLLALEPDRSLAVNFAGWAIKRKS